MKTFKADKSRHILRPPLSQKGVAALEMALVLPLLLVVVFGLFELSLGLLANNVITGMSREGANLYSRTGTLPADIMSSLAQTASQVNMVDNGIIYMTKIQEVDGNPQVVEQFRWDGSALGSPPNSQVWLCDGSSSWSGGDCNMGGVLDDAGRTATLNMALNAGEEVVSVEVFYIYSPAFDFFLKRDLDLYSRTLL